MKIDENSSGTGTFFTPLSGINQAPTRKRENTDRVRDHDFSKNLVLNKRRLVSTRGGGKKRAGKASKAQRCSAR